MKFTVKDFMAEQNLSQSEANGCLAALAKMGVCDKQQLPRKDGQRGKPTNQFVFSEGFGAKLEASFEPVEISVETTKTPIAETAETAKVYESQVEITEELADGTVVYEDVV